jgi:hypothetical protein
MLGWDRYEFHKNRTATCYSELVFLHPVGSTDHVVHSCASGAQNVDALFFMFKWDWYGFNKMGVGTCYAKLLFLLSVASAGHVVHYGASGRETSTHYF